VTSKSAAPIDVLLDVLDLRYLGDAHVQVERVEGIEIVDDSTRMLYEGTSQWQPHGRVFGGQVLAQCVIAAGRSVAARTDLGDRPRHLHSLHAYFIRPGDANRPIRFSVEPMRDGGSFSTRRVHAIQDDATLLSMITSFQTDDGGLDHQDPMPPAPDPDSLPSTAELLADVDHPAAKYFASGRPIDVRHADASMYLAPAPDLQALNVVWQRAMGPLPDDPLLHQAVLAYASDYSLLEPVLHRHGLAWLDRRLRMASLDHAMWFHRPARADEWVLYTQSSPSASGGRGLCAGRMFSRDGTLVATVAQEGMIRVKE
jgi:acyl-CoA thioesterase-2